MIGPWKTSITVPTFKRFSTGVFSIVAGEFVAAGKTPFTSFPWTFVRFFTCKKQNYHYLMIPYIIQNFLYYLNLYFSAIKLFSDRQIRATVWKKKHCEHMIWRQKAQDFEVFNNSRTFSKKKKKKINRLQFFH